MAADGAARPPLRDVGSVAGFEGAARSALPRGAWDYIQGGEAGTIARNRAAFGDYLLRPRVLVDVSAPDARCSLLGAPRASPVFLSSVAKGGIAAEGKEAVFVRAAARAGAAYIVPTLATLPLAAVWAAAAPGQRLAFQLYVQQDWALTMRNLAEALRLGASAVFVTVDANAPRRGDFDRLTENLAPGGISPKLTWDVLREVQRALPEGVPLYAKGVQTQEDALLAVRFGVRGLLVSNHGGRCTAGARSSLAALEEVSTALGEAPGVDLLYDGGVRCGLDTLKALCLGARGVGVGRPYYWAAAGYGEDGVVALLRLLTTELRHAMAQAGAPSLAALSRALLCRAAAPHAPLAAAAPPPAAPRL